MKGFLISALVLMLVLSACSSEVSDDIVLDDQGAVMENQSMEQDTAMTDTSEVDTALGDVDIQSPGDDEDIDQAMTGIIGDW